MRSARADKYREEAARLRREAENTTQPENRQQLLDIAAHNGALKTPLVLWKGRAGIFRRDVGDGEHAEVVIDGRVYRVRVNELS